MHRVDSWLQWTRRWESAFDADEYSALLVECCWFYSTDIGLLLEDRWIHIETRLNLRVAGEITWRVGLIDRDQTDNNVPNLRKRLNIPSLYNVNTLLRSDQTLQTTLNLFLAPSRQLFEIQDKARFWEVLLAWSLEGLQHSDQIRCLSHGGKEELLLGSCDRVHDNSREPTPSPCNNIEY